MTPKLKTIKIFCCPNCRNKRFARLSDLNIHLTKSHHALKLKIHLNAKGHAYTSTTSQA